MKKLNATMTLEQQQSLQERLVELVKEQKSGHQIANELGVNYTTVHRWLRKLELNLPNFHNELKFDNTVFDLIDTEEKAYWLGFMYADGHVSSDGKTVELGLKGDDREHLEKFRTFLKNKNKVNMGKSRCNGKEFSRCRLTMTNKHFHNALVSKGCFPNKSLILTFPDKSLFASEDLIIHFIRGYVDGDGCVSTSSSGYAIFEIIGTKEFLEGVKQFFPNMFTHIFHKDKRRPNSNTYFISIAAEKSAIFGELLYNNATIFLQRKYDKFINNKYDEREHFRRMHTFSEKKQLCYARAANRLRQNSIVSEDVQLPTK